MIVLMKNYNFEILGDMTKVKTNYFYQCNQYSQIPMLTKYFPIIIANKHKAIQF